MTSFLIVRQSLRVWKRHSNSSEILSYLRTRLAKKQTDLFTLLVELDVALKRDGKQLDADKIGDRLAKFYSRVDEKYKQADGRGRKPNPDVDKYLKAATKATNDKYARDARAEVISHVIAGPSSKTRK